MGYNLSLNVYREIWKKNKASKRLSVCVVHVLDVTSTVANLRMKLVRSLTCGMELKQAIFTLISVLFILCFASSL